MNEFKNDKYWIMKNKSSKEYLEYLLDFIPIWKMLMDVRDIKTTEYNLKLGEFNIFYERYGFYSDEYPISFISIKYKDNRFLHYDNTTFYGNIFYNKSIKYNLKIFVLLLQEIEGVLYPLKKQNRQNFENFIKFFYKCNYKCENGYNCVYGNSPEDCAGG